MQVHRIKQHDASHTIPANGQLLFLEERMS